MQPLSRRHLVKAGLASGFAAAMPHVARAQTTLKVVWMGWPDQQVLPLMAEFEKRNPTIKLAVERMGRGFAWLDTGTHETLLAASQFIETIERRHGLKVACPEEIAYRMGYISAAKLRVLARPLAKSGYGGYLLKMLAERVF